MLLPAEQRVALGLKTWPDGSIGFLHDGKYHDTYAPNAGRIAKVRHDVAAGTFETVYARRSIEGLPSELDYAGGGPVVLLPDASIVLMYHAERHPERHGSHQGPVPHRNFSSLGTAKSLDGGATFTDLGEIITPAVSLSEAPAIVEIGGGGFVFRRGKVYTYFRDTLRDGQQNQLAIARANGGADSREWEKNFKGEFSESGRGGLSSRINNPLEMRPIWFSVAYCAYNALFAIVYVQVSKIGIWELYMAWSEDGLAWSQSQPVETEVPEACYPSFLGLDENPMVLGQHFYVYYTASVRGGYDRWADAAVVRRRISVA